MYRYDNHKGTFNIMSDIDAFKVSEMVWDFIEDYEIFNITIRDHHLMRFAIDPLTGEETLIQEELPPQDPDVPPVTFDVSKYGEFLGMPRIKDQLDHMYEELKVPDLSKLSKE